MIRPLEDLPKAGFWQNFQNKIQQFGGQRPNYMADQPMTGLERFGAGVRRFGSSGNRNQQANPMYEEPMGQDLPLGMDILNSLRRRSSGGMY